MLYNSTGEKFRNFTKKFVTNSRILYGCVHRFSKSRGLTDFMSNIIRGKGCFFAACRSLPVVRHLKSRVVDPHRFNADPDPAFFLIADPALDTDPDPVSNPGF